MPRNRCRLCCALLLAVAVTGCTGDWFRRTSEKQAFEAPPTLPELKTIGTYASIVGVEPVKVFGVGIVQGLKGTGSNPPPSNMRQQALRELKAMGVDDPDEFLASSSTALVLVSAVIPPGVRKDDRLDVEVELMPEDKATSLQGGELILCSLHEYGDLNALRGRRQEGPRMVAHNKLAKAEGPVMVALSGHQPGEGHRRGRVWGGGWSLKERGFDLTLNKDNQSAAMAMNIAKTINDRFHSANGNGRRVVAEALNPQRITLQLPDQYRLNWPRYLRLLQVMPLAGGSQLNRALADRLGKELLEPARAADSALQLEALGHDSIPYLKQVLKAMHPTCRFCAAEALAYLGDPACAETLAEMAREHAEFRAYALTALASLNEAVCHLKLRELMHEPTPELRYGAFKALRMLNENDPMVRGTKLAGGFHLHRVPSQTPGLIHVSLGGRAEIVIFGEEPALQAPFSFRAGEDFVVTAREGEDQCMISRYSLHLGQAQESTSLKVTDVVASLGKMQASYGDVVAMLTSASETKTLNCAFAIDALPSARPVGTGQEAAELGDTPNLFSRVGRLLVGSEGR